MFSSLSNVDLSTVMQERDNWVKSQAKIVKLATLILQNVFVLPMFWKNDCLKWCKWGPTVRMLDNEVRNACRVCIWTSELKLRSFYKICLFLGFPVDIAHFLTLPLCPQVCSKLHSGAHTQNHVALKHYQCEERLLEVWHGLKAQNQGISSAVAI